MNKPFLNQTTTSVTSAQSAFCYARAAQIKASKNPYKSTGARALAQYAPIVRTFSTGEHRMDDKGIAAMLRDMPASTVSHLSVPTLTQYVIAARAELGIRKNQKRTTNF